ncbi:peptidoglycan-binding protein [Methylobacterium sp. Leaf456]|uniref:peptidoglycan-binding domain-containing protein n=1 Tax=Methylobacterium sp. Leaf456 TaxID=1736382 RepID=UPI0006FD8110|nr:peptidoglycan-binding domain-containing protein [Methylobacterium sp. Leaf456]KQT47940.1 peptidoglycan-binding protein [Methylobacterium sp. Leaf456]
MRETPAGRDRRDIVVPGDMRGGRAAPRRTKPNAATHGVPDSAKAFARAAGTWCLRHPGGALGSLAACGAAIYVCLNAVGFQDGRHPAPILPTVEAKAVAPKAPDAKVAEAKPSPVRPAPAREVRAEAPPPRDAIADMIRSGETTASVTPKSSAKEAAKVDVSKADPAKPDPAVARAQRALVKLGYGPLKDDGLMGPGTRAAIERFERDRKLPVKGEAAGRTLRELTTAKAAAVQG